MKERDFFSGQRQFGVTLIELIVTVVVIAILATIAVPSFVNFFESQRIRGAVSAYANEVQFARTQALKTNQKYSISFKDVGGSSWCFGSAVGEAGCDCSVTPSTCIAEGGVKRVTKASDFPNVAVSTAMSTMIFEPKRGVATGASNITVENSLGAIRIEHTMLGRTSSCVSSGSGISGVDAC